MGMLVLSREFDEEVVIDSGEGRVVVKVLEIRHGKVRLGFAAGPEFKIHRREIQERVDAGREGGGR